MRRPWPWTALALACTSLASGEPTVLVQYDYEHYAQAAVRATWSPSQYLALPYRTATLDSGDHAGVGQIIALPEGAKDVCGVRFKLSKSGSPGPVRWTLGRTRGGEEIAAGTVSPDEVIALFELFYGGDFPPSKVEPRETLFLTLRAESGRYPDDYYIVYGPAPEQGKPADAKSEGLSPPGQEPFPLSYKLITSAGTGESDDEEERFRFVYDMTRAPYSRAKLLRDPDRRAQPAETEVDASWTLIAPADADAVVGQAAWDLATFLERVMGVRLAVEHCAIGPDVLKRSKVILLGGRQSLPELGAMLAKPESYRVLVEPQRIVLVGADARGTMRAVYYLEDVMSFALGPMVRQGDLTRNCLFSPRLTQTVAPSHVSLTQFSHPHNYTDGLLWHISHQGFNAIWFFANLEQLTGHSKVFPELNDDEGVEGRYRRLRELTQRAARYGIDVYLYYATNYHHPVPDSFYEKHPDCRGVGWGNAMCTSRPEVQRYFDETTRNLFRAAPFLKGLVIIFDSEGFFSCAAGKDACPRCRSRAREDIVAEYLHTIHNAMKDTRPDSELIAWSYFTHQPEWVIRAIPKLPKGITLQSEFSKGAVIERDGVRHVTGDYQITEIGPPDSFVEQSRAAKAAGLRVSAKTEHSYSQEFVNAPYIPVPFQFHKRIMKIRQYPVDAVFGNWSHYGYVPNLNAEVFKWCSWDGEPPIDALLLDVARRDFGPKAAPAFVDAWRRFSKGITYYPYSDGVGRYPGPIQVGPAHPLPLDRTLPGGGWVRDWQNDLKWTRPWGPEIVLKYFGLLEAEWREAVQMMEQALADVPAEKREAARRELGVGKSLWVCVRSCLNFTQFFLERDKLYAEQDPAERGEIAARMRSIAEAELANARVGLELCKADSRIGYTSHARIGGVYTPALIRRKIEQVEKMLEELPKFAERITVERR
ncbi:MAG: hypothetical protein HUU20_08345 [Pirellulales bacterium]|nr:hypothetical protein [Pirellulales bacterium]